jgi:hypothetical protein
MLEAVRQDGISLQRASKELIGDKSVVLEARKPTGYLLKHASEELRGQQGGCAGGCDEGRRGGRTEGRDRMEGHVSMLLRN